MTKIPIRAWLVIAAAALLIGNTVWRVYAGWGLVTIQAVSQPLGDVLRDIEGQAHITLKTDLDLKTPVSLRLRKAPLTETLERLSVLIDARWRLVYVMAGDSASVRYALGAWQAGNPPATWRWINHPLGAGSLLNNGPGSIPDPRGYSWQVRKPSGAVQDYLDQGSRVSETAFFIPAGWNPSIDQPPVSGQVREVAPQLAKAARGNVEEVFLLMKSRRGGNRAARNGSGGSGSSSSENGGERPERGGLRRDLLASGEETLERVQQRIAQLPADQRAAAQAEFDAERDFWLSIRDLPAEERADKVRDHFHDPALQQRVEDRNAARDALRSPEQRLDRARRYVQRRAAASPQPE